MNRLFAPWRMKYILDNNKENGCIFCNFPEENKDEKRFILARSEKCFIMLNAFPYNNGHLMVSPYRHIADYDDLSIEELVDIHVNVQKVIKMLKRVQNPQGFNVGLNLGKTAGAGFDEHLHIHIVPRWNGDTNFMPVLDDTRVIPQSLLETYRTLKNDWDKHE
jgi:ATP adenylyltransferase